MARSGNRRTREEDREERLAALRIPLQEAAGKIQTAADWARCLQAAARLPDQSWPNVLLISSRLPDATLAQGYEAWRSVGRQVNREEKGIEIFSGPRQHNDEQARSWRDAHRVTLVWDLSQTSGQPLPARAATPSPPGDAPPGLWDCLCWLARREGFAVERSPGCPADGVTQWTARRIRVLPGLTAGQDVWALAHQLGHVLLHTTIAAPPGASTAGCRGVRKAEADSVAFITCIRHGVQIEHAFSSPQTWAGSDPRAQPGAAILAVGERITTAAAQISRHVDHHLLRSTTLTASAAGVVPSPEPDPQIESILLDAQAFYIRQVADSWVPAYLRTRGITATATGEWHIGYAPPRMDRAHGLPPWPRPHRRRDPGRRAGPHLLPRDAHRPLPGPGHAAGPR